MVRPCATATAAPEPYRTKPPKRNKGRPRWTKAKTPWTAAEHGRGIEARLVGHHRLVARVAAQHGLLGAHAVAQHPDVDH